MRSAANQAGRCKAARWLAVALACGLVSAHASVPSAARATRKAAADTVRSSPTRPGSAASADLGTRRIAGVEYVNLEDASARLGLKFAWRERGRKAVLTGPSVRAEIERDTRDIEINGLRVFLGDPVVDAGGLLYVSRIDYERCLAPQLRPGFGVAPLRSPRTIVLDPGHGGRDHGTSATEKVHALDVARRAKKLLEAAGHQVVLTRDRDVYLELPQRSAIANAASASLFASIHFNALPRDSKTSGVEIYTFAPQHQRSTSAWGVTEANDTEREAAPVNRFDHWSVVLAHAIHRRFVVDLKSFDRGKKIAHWGVLRGLNCPGVLIECGFLTSDVEAKKIATPAHRQKLAEAIADGIRDYVATLEHVRGKAAANKTRRPRTAL